MSWFFFSFFFFWSISGILFFCLFTPPRSPLLFFSSFSPSFFLLSTTITTTSSPPRIPLSFLSVCWTLFSCVVLPRSSRLFLPCLCGSFASREFLVWRPWFTPPQSQRIYSFFVFFCERIFSQDWFALIFLSGKFFLIFFFFFYLIPGWWMAWRHYYPISFDHSRPVDHSPPLRWNDFNSGGLFVISCRRITYICGRR